jgi:hypothetical protein
MAPQPALGRPMVHRDAETPQGFVGGQPELDLRAIGMC